MKNRACGQLILYALLHFCVDWACILLVTGPVRLGVFDHSGWLWCLLLYNASAFALQLPLGALLDALGHERCAVWLGCLLVALGWLLRWAGLWCCVIAGIGNALFHLGAGGQVLAHSMPRAAPSGIFVSTGAVGVWLGALCARQGLTGPALPLILMLLGAAAAAVFPAADEAGADKALPGKGLGLWTVLGCALLVLVVGLRSWAGGLMAYPWLAGLWGLWAVLCVLAGKALGGLLGDRFGFGPCAAVSLLAAAGAFLLAPSLPVFGLAAAFLFNTSMSLTLVALANALGAGHRALAFGMTTFAIFLGTIPAVFGAPGVGDGLLLCLIALGSLLLFLLGLRCIREDKPC